MIIKTIVITLQKFLKHVHVLVEVEIIVVPIEMFGHRCSVGVNNKIKKSILTIIIVVELFNHTIVSDRKNKIETNIEKYIWNEFVRLKTSDNCLDKSSIIITIIKR